MRRCKWCKDGLRAMDGEKPYVVCALLPPAAKVLHGQKGEVELRWVRPPMSLNGWCGQFRLGLRAFFGYGARA